MAQKCARNNLIFMCDIIVNIISHKGRNTSGVRRSATHKNRNPKPASRSIKTNPFPYVRVSQVFSIQSSSRCHHPNRGTGTGFLSGVCDGGVSRDGYQNCFLDKVIHHVGFLESFLACGLCAYAQGHWLLLRLLLRQRANPIFHRPFRVLRIRHLLLL
jgi:hypothetical protein